MIYLAIYLIQFFDGLRTAIAVTMTITPFLLIAYSLILEDDYCINKIKKAIKIAIITLLILTSMLIIIPTKETMYQFGAIYVGKQINTTVQVDEKLKKVSKIIDLKLDEIIKKQDKGENYE